MAKKMTNHKMLQCKVSPETSKILSQIKWGMQAVFIEHAIQLAFENSKFKEWFLRTPTDNDNAKDS